MKRPIYKVEVKAYLCSVELNINNIPCFYFYNEPQVATENPINSLIFYNGKQTFEVTLNPILGEQFLHKDSKIEITIFMKEAFSNYLEKRIITKYISNPFSNKEVKHYYKGTFDANLPFEFTEILKVETFDKNNTDQLKEDLYSEYVKFYNLIISNDLKGYNDYTKLRFDDISKSHYLPEEKKLYYLQKALSSYRDTDLSLINKEQYYLDYYFENNIIGLKKINVGVGLILEDNNKKDEGIYFIESALFIRDQYGNLVLYR